MASYEFNFVRDAANAYFDGLERLAQQLGSIVVDEDSARKAKELEVRIVQAAAALLELGRNPLIGDEDHKDLRLSVRRMSAALRLRGYQQWDTRVVFDEDVYRGTEPGGQSEYDLGSVARARDEFNAAAEQFERVAIVAGAAGAPADHDDLLPLLRRKSFDQDLSKFFADAESTATPVALLMIDVDHFKRVNDEHGHQVGDEALKSVASAVKHVVSGKGRAYRYGGEEMAVLAINLDAAEAVALGERIRQEIGREKRTSKALEITVSVGVAVYPIHASDATALVARADAAMYRAKHDGRNLTRVGNDEGGPAPIIEVRAASKEASELARGASPEQPPSDPFKIPRMNDPELEKVSEHYRSLGREPVLPRMESRDVNLARGYELAVYPGTAREVWVGFNSGAYEHLLMLKPSPKP